MIAGDAATVAELNRRARAAACCEGTVARERPCDRGRPDGRRRRRDRDPSEQPAAGTAGKSWVKNGDRFVVVSTNPDGTMAVRRSSRWRRGDVCRRTTWPSTSSSPMPRPRTGAKVARSTPRTRWSRRLRHARCCTSPRREGASANMLYVDTAFDPIPLPATTARSRHRARATCSPACSRTRVRTSPRTRPSRGHNARQKTSASSPPSTRPSPAWPNSNAGTTCSIAQDSDLDRLEQVRQSPAYGPLLAAFRDAESRGLDVERAFPDLVAARVTRRRGGPSGGHARPGGALGTSRRVDAAGEYEPHRRTDPTSGRRHRSRHGPGP